MLGQKCSSGDMLYWNIQRFISRPKNLFAKYLGVLLDENLSFLQHIQAVELKISGNLGIIKSTVSQETFILLYNTFIKPSLHHYAVIWQSTFKNHLQKLNLTNKRSLRLIRTNEEYLSTESLHYPSSLTFLCSSFLLVNPLCI